jgi:hypothetical protein
LVMVTPVLSTVSGLSPGNPVKAEPIREKL